MTDSERVRELQKHIAFLLNIRTPWATAWQDIKEVVRPVRGFSISSLVPRDMTVEDLIPSKVVDNKAARALRMLVAGLYSGLTPQSRPWFALRLEDEELMEYGPVKNWLYQVQQILYGAFARSNFYSSIFAMYFDLAPFCSGCMSMETRSGLGLRFQDIPIGSFAWGADSDGNIHTLARHLSIPARELVRRYGENKVHPSTAETAKKDPYKGVDVIYAVMPRAYSDREPGKIDRRSKPFASYLFEHESNHLVDEGGFDSFPFLCARWDVLGGEIYGRGSGFEVLPDVRNLQSVSRDQSMAIRMSVTPPMKLPASLKGEPIYLIPGAKNYVSEQQAERIGPMFELKADIAAASAKIAELHQAIREGYFNDLFLMLAGTDKAMTAFEVDQRNAEKMLMLGPVVSRHQIDILDPAISSTYTALFNMGGIPPVPEEIAGADLSIDFLSVLAQAQRLPEANSIRKVVGDVAGMVQANPESMAQDKIDYDQAVDELANIEGVPPKIIRTDDTVANIRRQRAEAQQQQQRMQMLMEAGKQTNEAVRAMGGARGLAELAGRGGSGNA